jgi:hypothetical protein
LVKTRAIANQELIAAARERDGNELWPGLSAGIATRVAELAYAENF